MGEKIQPIKPRAYPDKYQVVQSFEFTETLKHYAIV
uniref:Uncharacterized protein n=1 Tax=uncultured Flavobacteriia bacterium TaxID=212695 RepID=H6RHM4_9BACT|nr:hypothetical protein VIS_S3DGC10001 [uncultured Flavobacteriia bacterium]